MKKILVVCALSLFNSCSKSPQRSLERVAKDWSMTVRASQVMPVYPLEEDLRPGDVYLVERSIDKEVTNWKKRGFLKLNNRYDRIHISRAAYDKYYYGGFSDSENPSFNRAPLAAFPSYSFETDKRGALGLAIPLKSVPIALSAAGAQRAVGTAVFSDATTQGLPDKDMESHIQVWAQKNRAELARKSQLRYKNLRKPLILRVITRVYMIKGADVSLTFSKTRGLNAQAGSSTEIPSLNSATKDDYAKLITDLENKITLLTNTESPSVEIQEEAEGLEKELEALKKEKSRHEIESISKRIERAGMQDKYGGYVLPGGGIKVSSRSSRGITLEETFDKPLVLGFLAKEYVVSSGGNLIEIGSMQDLLDNPTKYKSLTLEAKRISQLSPTRATNVDDGNPDTNPLIQNR